MVVSVANVNILAVLEVAVVVRGVVENPLVSGGAEIDELVSVEL